MEQVTAYCATDGSLHRTATDCQEREVSLMWQGKIDEFTTTGLNPYPRGVHAGMCRKIIVAWEMFKTGG